MIKLSINTTTVEVENGATVLEAALKAGFEIPTMCDNGEVEHFASCMVCVVKNAANSSLLPACSAKAVDGMRIITEDAELTQARKTAIELLMSEHVGDCQAPCTVACPASMNIPLMNRFIAAGETAKALEVVRKDIALPGVLGRICPAPCEGVCRRKPMGQSVSICLLKRFASDDSPVFIPNIDSEKAFRIGIVGSGPAGLSAAYYLRLRGMQVSVYDHRPLPGGSLRYDIPQHILDSRVLDNEVELIANMGVRFIQNAPVDAALFATLQSECDAVVLATGNYVESMNDWGLENDGKHLLVNKNTYQTNLDKVFAIGNANKSGKLAIRSAAQGKEVAFSIEQLFMGLPLQGEHKTFNSTIGKIYPDEYAEYMRDASSSERQMPKQLQAGFDAQTARIEAERCMDCDCRKAEGCILRLHADQLNIAKRRFNYSQRVRVSRNSVRNLVVYEPGKCIKCGVCVRLTAKHQEEFGFTFIGRGFNVVVGIPFDATVEKALEKTVDKVIKACPTGALAATEKKR